MAIEVGKVRPTRREKSGSEINSSNVQGLAAAETVKKEDEAVASRA